MTWSTHHEIQYAAKQKNLLMLGRAGTNDKDPFANCPWGGVSWPAC